MYFISIQRLKTELIAARRKEADYYPYVLAPIACAVIADGARLFLHLPHRQSAGVGLLEGCVVLAGTMAAFWANGGRAGLHFLRRYLSIWWVFAVRFCIFCIPFFVLWLLWLREAILSTFFRWPPMGVDRGAEMQGAADAWMGVVVTCIFFWRLSVHIRDLYWRTVRANAFEKAADYEHRTSGSSEPPQSSGR